jgi:hypothetical protein
MICMICHDTHTVLSKICNCNESLICKSCLQKLNKEKVDKCPICREILTMKVYYNNKTFYNYLLYYLFILLGILLIEICPILYFIYNNNYTENSSDLFYNKSFQYYTVLFNVLIIQPINYLYMLNFFIDRVPNHIINKDGILFISIMTIIHMMFDIVLVGTNIGINFFLVYFSCICIPFFIIPFGIIYVKLFSEYYYNIKYIMKDNSRVNKIRVNEIIVNEINVNEINVNEINVNENEINENEINVNENEINENEINVNEIRVNEIIGIIGI